MNYATRLLLLSLIFLPANAYAKLEGWYSYWSAGLANHDHPAAWEQFMSQEEAADPDNTRIGVSTDMFGFYWPIQDTNILGFVINGSADRVADGTGNSIDLTTYSQSLSYLHFLGKEPGDGLFLRADYGQAKATISSTNGSGNSLRTDIDTGTGYLLGAGFGRPINSYARVIIGVNTTSKKIGRDTFKSNQFTIGILW